MKETVVGLLNERGVTIKDIAEIVYELQIQYVPITIDDCIFHVEAVLEKREVQNAMLTGIALDKLTEQKLIEEPLLSILSKDEALYGVDEVLALSITNIYGSIGFTNFGYLDKVKPGIIGVLNSSKEKGCHTFLDDLVSGIAAAACSRIAHSKIENKKD